MLGALPASRAPPQTQTHRSIATSSHTAALRARARPPRRRRTLAGFGWRRSCARERPASLHGRRLDCRPRRTTRRRRRALYWARWSAARVLSIIAPATFQSATLRPGPGQTAQARRRRWWRRWTRRRTSPAAARARWSHPRVPRSLQPKRENDLPRRWRRQRCYARLPPRRPPQWPIINQASGRSTAKWSQIVFALDGPTPILTKVMPERSGAIR